LVKLIREWNPDIIHIGHEYGFFAKAYQFTSLVSALQTFGYKIVSTMHSVYDHLDKLVTEACVPNLIVHTDEAKKCLIQKGVNGKIFVVPHGVKILKGTAENPELLGPLWNTWYTNHTILQPGFLFEYKGHARIIKLLPKLKEKYGDVHYIIQGAENPHTIKEHNNVYTKLVNLAQSLGVMDNITIIRGFVSKNVLLSYIRTVKCCVLPYDIHPEHNVRSSSGIARMVLNTTTPLIVSNVHFFDDLDKVAIKVKSDEELYEAIESVFDTDIDQELNKEKIDYLRNNCWENVAKLTSKVYGDILKG
jgi:glycosyltransferase involved in cell wall biosynthesis